MLSSMGYWIGVEDVYRDMGLFDVSTQGQTKWSGKGLSTHI